MRVWVVIVRDYVVAVVFRFDLRIEIYDFGGQYFSKRIWMEIVK